MRIHIARKQSVPFIVCNQTGHAPRSSPGFTLVEILVGLLVAGMLMALLAAIIGRGSLTSSALGESVEQQHSRVVLHRLLDMDLRNMLPRTQLAIDGQGIIMETSHNHLVPGPLPVTVTWDFSGGQLRRIEEQPELEYRKELVLIAAVAHWSLELYDLPEKRWVDLLSWQHGPQRPAPAGLRLELRISGAPSAWTLTHRLSLEHDAPR